MDALLEAAKHTSIAVALSGGSDSMALFLKLHELSPEQGFKLIALTVDHGLRDASKEEALHAARFCAKHGVEHHILTWTGTKPATGLPLAARKARYRLLAEFCAKWKITTLALGHTADDQAETVLMRLNRTTITSDPRGLSGIPAKSLYQHGPDFSLTLVRPLLDQRRHDLQDTLTEAGHHWISDPTNNDKAFERVRTRQFLSAHPAMTARLLAYSNLLKRERAHLAEQAATFLDKNVAISQDWVFRIKRQALLNVAPQTVCYVLQTLISVAGGRDHLPPRAKVEELLHVDGTASLGRCLVHSCGQMISIRREDRNLPMAMPVSTIPQLWDRRVWIWADKNPEPGIEVIPAKLAPDQSEKTFSSPLITFCSDNKVTKNISWKSISSYDGVCFKPALGAFENFCPASDWPIREALKRLFTRLVYSDDAKG